MANIFKSALSAIGVEIETTEPDVVAPAPSAAPAARTSGAPSVAPAASAPVADTDVTQAEADTARGLALEFADYKAYPMLQRYMVMEAKSKVDGDHARAQAVLDALSDAADISPDSVRAQARTAAEKLRARTVTHTQSVSAAAVALDSERAQEAKSLEAAITADSEQIRLITARMERARADLNSLDGRYAAKKAANTRGLAILTEINALLLAKWDILTQKASS